MESVTVRLLATLCAIVILPVVSWAATPQTLIRGDCNADGEVDVADPSFLMNCLYQGGTCCQDACDSNDNGIFNSADASYLFSFLYEGGPAPRPPYPDCAVDSSLDTLVCNAHAFCDDGTGGKDPVPLGALRIEDFTIPFGEEGTARVLAFDPDATGTTPLQGFQVAVESPPGLELVDINIAGTVTEQEDAELVISNILDPNGLGRLVVMMDLEEPFEQQIIPLGAQPVHIANFVYICDEPPVAEGPPVEHDLFVSSVSLFFVEGNLRDPAEGSGTAQCLPPLSCPDSDQRPTVVLGDCDSGVRNLVLDEANCISMADQIADCAASARNHGQFVSCVAHLTARWRKADLIGPHDHAALIRCAAHSKALNGSRGKGQGKGQKGRK